MHRLNASGSSGQPVDDAENVLRGEATSITRDGEPVAVVAPIAVSGRMESPPAPTLADLIVGFPVDLDDVIVRDQTPIGEF